MTRRIVISAIIVLVLLLSGCLESTPPEKEGKERDYRQDMRDFVIAISKYSKNRDAGFIIIPQNGHDILSLENGSTGPPAMDYMNAIDGVGQEDLYYGYEDDDKPTPVAEKEWLMSLLDLAEENGVQTLVTDYCYTEKKMDDSYKWNAEKDYISFAANHRNLDNIPSFPMEPYNANDEDIDSLSDARNFLYLLEPSSFTTKEEYLSAIRDTEYDVLIIDAFYGNKTLNPDDVSSLKTKKCGGSRLIISYMSIGEAEDYRYYWQEDWKVGSPDYLDKENPVWEGNYKVMYWDPDWQKIIFGSEDSYLDKILASGFDGVYLDIIDAFEYYEDL